MVRRYLIGVWVVLMLLVQFLVSPSAVQMQESGAPILLVVNDDYAANPFGRYLGEILRAEGLNAYDVVELGSLTASDLAAHDLTILAETSLTADQANLLISYVNDGGRLLAMRPDPQIKGLFGLGDAAGGLTDGYLKIQTAAVWNGWVPGQGLTGETLQIHGVADCYEPVGGAVVLAQLYSDATTATPYPAVIGASSGRAVAFTYDLVHNVVYTRQGNPANADLDVDGDGVVRTIDLFMGVGGGSPWVDRDKIPIPQADEQQRLLARLVEQMVGEVRPLPRLWYFPGDAKTVLILTADAHGNPVSYYQREINSLNALGAKATFYLGIAEDPPESAPGENNDVLDWVAQGHGFGIHPYWYHPDPYPPYDTHNLSEGYDAWDMWFGLQYPNTPKSLTVRNHQVAWEGWTDAAEIAETHGYRLDTNFYHWGAWLQKADNSWPHGYITGSGQPMKFVRADGRIINVYQQLTQLVDEQLIRPPDWAFENLDAAGAIAVSREMIDASVGGYYAALMMQIHVDYYEGDTQEWAEGTVEYANGLGVPVWNADQWLSFTEVRHDANYTNITWVSASRTLGFDLSAAATPGVSLTTILPLSYQGNSLESVRVDGSPVNHSIQTIKGINVAFVTVPAGNHHFEVRYQESSLPALMINDVNVAEGNGGTTQAVFTVTLSKVSTSTVSVSYFTADGSAVAPGDYTTISGTLVFAPGQTSRTLTVTVIGDTLDEEDETFTVNLSNPVNAGIADGQGVGTIVDDDPEPALSISDASVVEGDSGTASAVFTVTLSAASGRTVSVTYATADGTATAGTDYTGASGTLVFVPGQVSRTLTLTVNGDTLDEEDETFYVNLSNPVNASIADGQGVGTIVDDDPEPALSISDASVAEGDSGTASAVFTVTLSAASGRTVSVTYATADGTATAGADYTGASGTLVFAPGQTSRTLTVTVIGDTLDEEDETFWVSLSNPVNASIADGQGVGTIRDDDVNLPPVADAGPDQEVIVGTIVQLDGSNSIDPEGHFPLVYRWQQTGGTPVVLSSDSISCPTFVAPEIPTVLSFTLWVTDALGLPGVSDSVVITVSDESIAGLSVVSTGPTIVGYSVAFTATVARGTNVNYRWDFGDGVVLDNGPTVTHTYQVTGTYIVVVTASNSVSVLAVTLEVDVTGPPLNNKIYLPLIMAGRAAAADGAASAVLTEERKGPTVPVGGVAEAYIWGVHAGYTVDWRQPYRCRLL